jgi:hypothetical protein
MVEKELDEKEFLCSGFRVFGLGLNGLGFRFYDLGIKSYGS